MTMLPLLPAQRPKWEEWLADPASGAHGIGTLLRVRGPLDPPLLQAALDALEAAQPALRVTFLDGLQVVHAPHGVRLRSEHAEDARVARSLGAALAEEPFDLLAGPMLRALLVRLADDDHLLALALPHVVVDGWSMNLLITDLERVYRDLVAGRTPQLEDQTAVYAEICARRSAADPQAGYREWIAGVPRLVLPTDLPRPDVRNTRSAEVRVELGTDTQAEITAAARRLRTSPFPLLFTAFALVLGQRSGQHRFLVNAFVAGRTRPEEDHVIGRFANMLPMPVDLTAPDLVRATSRMWWDSYDFHDVSATDAARAVEGDPPVGRLPLADVLFVLNVSDPELAADGQPRITREREPGRYSLRDLTLFVGPTATGFELRLDYRTDLYREDTAWTLLHDCRDVLAGLTSQRDNSDTSMARARASRLSSA
jgi:hypothetical protein